MVHKHLSIFQPYNSFTNEINLSNDWHIYSEQWCSIGEFLDVAKFVSRHISFFPQNFGIETFPRYQLRCSRKKICVDTSSTLCKFCVKNSIHYVLLSPAASITRLVIILSNRLYILLYNQSSIICGLEVREEKEVRERRQQKHRNRFN